MLTIDRSQDTPTPPDFAARVAQTYANDRRCDDSDQLRALEHAHAAIGTHLGLQIRFDAAGLDGELGQVPGVATAIVDGWDGDCWGAAHQIAVVERIMAERPRSPLAARIANKIGALMASTWLVATSRYATDRVAEEEPAPAMLPRFCSIPPGLRDRFRDAHARVREGLDAEVASRRLTADELARLAVLRTRIERDPS
jgi:hypothetical protein